MWRVRTMRLTALPARPLSPDAQATEINTAGGNTVSLLGTYDYMSPEQKTGEAVDARSDLYALGLIMYRMLTGHKPEGTYDPPSKSGVSRRWDPILARCLKRDLKQRYQSAAELRKDVQAMATPVHRRVPMVVAVAVVASLCTALASLYLKKATPRSESMPAPATHVEAEAEPGEVVVPFAVDVKPAGASLTVRRGRDVMAEIQSIGRAGTELRLKPGVYSFRLELAGYRIVERDVAVGEDQPKRWRFNSALSAEIWESGMLLGRTGEWIRKTLAGRRALELRRTGYRPASLAVDVPPNAEAEVEAPALEMQEAHLVVQIEITGRTVAPEHRPKEGTLKIGSAEPVNVQLPWKQAVRDLDRALAVDLKVPGYDVSKPESVTFHDRDQKTLTFRLLPHPVRLTIQSNVPASIYRLRDGQFAQGWRRALYGRDAPIGQTGEPLTMDAFIPQKLTVVAEGYQPATLDIHLLRPGAPDETIQVELTPAPKS